MATITSSTEGHIPNPIHPPAVPQLDTSARVARDDPATSMAVQMR